MTPAKRPAAGGSKAKKAMPKKTTAKKTTAKKTTKKTVAKKPAPKKTAAKKTAAKKTVAKKTAARKTTKKTVAKKAAPRKTAAKKTTAKKASAKKTTTKKTTAAKTAAKPAAGKPAPKTTTAPGGKGKKAVETLPKKPVAAGRPFVRPAPPTAPKRRTRPATFDKEQLKKVRASLETKRTELGQRMAELEESFDSTQSDITGEVGLDEDFADAGTATFERERDLSIRNNIRDLIDQMTRAINRIDEGTYGTCERCGQPIDAARLRELPHASLCLDCKRREERAR